LGATYVRQDVRRQEESTLAEGNDVFFVIDAAAGFRFPQRRALISLEARNLFDQGFKLQDDSFRKFGDEPAISPFIPERTILARLTLNF
jgi:hypothetical protein